MTHHHYRRSQKCIPFLIITTFLLIEQNNFTPLVGSSLDPGSNDTDTENMLNSNDLCSWPPDIIMQDFNPNFWAKVRKKPWCDIDEIRQLPHDTHKASAYVSPPSAIAQESSFATDDARLVLDQHEQDLLRSLGLGEPIFLPTEPPPPSSSVEEDVNKSKVPSSEDTIPSFSEWTKLQLAQRKESIINNINKDKTLQHQEGKNFASPICGAKIRNNNPEAQNPGGIISSSNDEYMLNRCTSKIWFILELCEPLQIEKVVLGNLELFASNPHEIDLEIGTRYPTRDWNLLGTFHAPDIRNVHSLILPASGNSTFGKFLRITIKSHHGSEHYCPLSLIKVFGKSEYEVLESESSSGADSDDQNRLEDENSSLYEEDLSYNNPPVTKSVLGAAKDAVLNMVQKAVNVLGNGNKSTTSTVIENVTANDTLSTCISLVQCVEQANNSYRDSILGTLSCKPHSLLWMTKVTTWCGWDYCHRFLKSFSIGSPWTPEGFFVAIYGPSIIDSMCNFLHPLKSCTLVQASIHGNKTADDVDPFLELANGVPNKTLEPMKPDKPDTTKTENKTPERVQEPAPSNVEVPVQQPSQTGSISGTEGSGQNVPNTFPPSPIEQLQQQHQPNEHQQKEPVQQGQRLPADEQKSPLIDLPQPTPSSFIIVESPTGGGGGIGIGTQQQQFAFTDELYSPSQQQNKESVFVRLSNRIKALEINQSLSSGYLEELSRRFKKQNEDINNAHEMFRNLLSEAMKRSKWLENSFRYEIRKLSRSIENLREVIYKVEVQRSGLIIFGVLQFFCTILVFWKSSTHSCCGCKCRVTTAQSLRASMNTQKPTEGSRVSGEFNPQLHPDFAFRKRSNSEQLKKVSKKKKRKDLMSINNPSTANDVFSFKSPPIFNSTQASSSVDSSTNSGANNQNSKSTGNGNGTKNGNNSNANSSKSSNNAAATNNGPSVTVPTKTPATSDERLQNGPKTSNDNSSECGSSKSGSTNSLNNHPSKDNKKVKSLKFWK